MSSYTTEAFCNIALLGHTGAGKTTLAEQLLHRAGAIPSPGSVEAKSTVCDHDPQEKAHGHSLDSTVVHFEHGGRLVNLLDTPGYPDLLCRALTVLPAVETAAVVVNAAAGIEPGAVRVMQEALHRRLCRMVVVNQIDAAADLPGLLAELQAAFGSECLPINLPADGGGRVVDCFFQPSGDADFLGVEAAHTALVDQVVEVDEALMTLYLEQGEEIRPEQLHEPFEQALRDGHLIPVCFTSARTGAGVAELLEVLAQLMPNPLEGNPPPFLRRSEAGEDALRARPDPDARLLAFVFRVIIDPFIGRVGLLRVAQGTLRKDQPLLLGDARTPVRLARLYRPQGGELVEIDTAAAGDIVAVAKVEGLHYGAVLHEAHEDDHVVMRPVALPAPVFGLAIEPLRRGDEKKLSEAMEKIAVEDAGVAVERDPSTRETVLRGHGELHLQVMLERMRDRHHVEVSTHTPRIAYRETVTTAADGHCRHKKQTGGAGQFAEVYLRIEPLPRGGGFEFASEVVGGAIPTALVPAVEKGVREVLESGAISGHPLQDVRVVVYDGKHHPVDSKEIAFAIAGRKAFLDAVHKAGPVVLEPIVRLEATAPEPTVGAITGDLAAKRGRISDTRTHTDGTATVLAEVPLAELSRYESELKSMTSGRGRYAVEPLRYEPVPASVQERLVAARRAAGERAPGALARE